MRLTLRTLLAYLDDVLDPVDKEELAHKIESSEFAEDLVHRTRDTVRRLRLSAPQVIGTGMGLDPNTVAEYLDNVMPPEQVGDFERICLESDVHLAEATACHHVLTMVLGEPADVDPIARQRMYTIASESGVRKQIRIEPAHTASIIAAAAPMAAATAVPSSPLPMPVVRRHSVEVPEYLRAAPWWRSAPVLLGTATIVIVGSAILFGSSLRGWFGGNKTLEPLTVKDSMPPAGAVAMGTSAPPSDLPPEPADEPAAPPSETVASSPPLASPPQLATPGLPPLGATTKSQSTPAAPDNSAQGDRYAVTSEPESNAVETPAATDIASAPPLATDAATPPATDAATTEAATAVPDGSAAMNLAAPPLGTPPVAAAANAPTEPLAVSGGAATDAAGAGLPPAEGLAAATPPQGAAAVPPQPEPGAETVAPAAPPDAGIYMGGKTVLLRHDDQSGAWFRVEPRAAIVPGERVLSLPEFRSRIALTSGVQLDIAGGTQAIMGIGDAAALPADPAAGGEHVPGLELVYGRIVLINPTNGDKQIRLKLGEKTGVAKILRNHSLAVEVERKFVPGQDPRTTPAPVDVRLYAPDGGVVWTDAAGEKVAEKPSRWAITEAGAGEVAADPAPPEWIDREPIVQLSEQRYGAPVIESTIVSNTPVDTQLLELFQGSSRKEVKSLVARSSIHVGLFQPFVDALRDSEQKANWKTHIDTLRTAMAMGPESANKVYQALVDQRGKPAAADLYEMLCSYTPDQVGRTADEMKNGAVVKLINWLEDDSLDYRVLAAQDLWEITGKRLMPNPAASLAERKQNVRVWRSRLESGQLLKPVSAAKPEDEAAGK